MAHNPDFVGKEAAEQERTRKPPQIESKREWEHGDGGSKSCSRKDKPVYTDVNKPPRPCYGDWGYCGNDQWKSKGIVQRIKDTKQVITRDGKKV